jgi:hypothetical protein
MSRRWPRASRTGESFAFGGDFDEESSGVRIVGIVSGETLCECQQHREIIGVSERMTRGCELLAAHEPGGHRVLLRQQSRGPLAPKNRPPAFSAIPGIAHPRGLSRDPAGGTLQCALTGALAIHPKRCETGQRAHC